MMKYILLFMVACLTSTSMAENLLCQVSINMEVQSKLSLQVPLDENILYAKFQPFQMRIKNLGASKFEIEVYDSEEPSRSYAKGTLRAEDDEVRWTLWRRDILLETSCSLASARALRLLRF